MRYWICLSVFEKLITSRLFDVVWCWWASSCLGSALIGVTAFGQSEERIEAVDQWEEAICLPPTWPSVRRSFNICFTFGENWENYCCLLGALKIHTARIVSLSMFCVLKMKYWARQSSSRVLRSDSRQNDWRHAIVSSSHNQSRAF